MKFVPIGLVYWRMYVSFVLNELNVQTSYL